MIDQKRKNNTKEFYKSFKEAIKKYGVKGVSKVLNQNATELSYRLKRGDTLHDGTLEKLTKALDILNKEVQGE